MKKFKLGSWKVEPNKSLLTSESGKEVRIEPLNMALLYYFLESPNEPVGREKLIEDVWDNKIVTDHAVYKTINQLRKYLASDGDEQEYIKTVPKKGYALVAPIEAIIEADPKDAINIKLETDSSSKLRKWFYKHPVLNTLGILVTACILSWNLGLASWWYQLTFPAYDEIALNNMVSGVNEVVPSEGDKYLLLTVNEGGASSNRGLHILHPGTLKHYQLLDDEHDYSKLSWSKSGNKIVVSRRSASSSLADECDLIILTLDESFKKVISEEVITQCSTYGSSSFLDDEKGILFYSYSKSEFHPASLFSMNIATKEVELITNSGDSSFGDWSIRISPDYKKMAFIRVYEEHNELFLMDLKTKETELLHAYPSYSDQISWSHDSENLFFQSLGAKILVYSLEHKFVKKVISREDSIHSLFHSKSQNKIYITAYEERKSIKVGEISNKTLEDHTKLPVSNSFDKFPSFANHSSALAFVSDRTGSDQVWLYKDGQISQLTSVESMEEAINFPRWSPTDKQIVFSQANTIYLYDFKTDETSVIYQDDENHAFVAMWDNLGKDLLFARVVGKRKEIFKINLETKELKQITTNGGYGGTFGPDGKYLYYVKEGHVGLWRLNMLTQEDIKVNDFVKIDAINSLQVFPDYLTFSVTDDFKHWSSYKFDYNSLKSELINKGKLADPSFNYQLNKVAWSDSQESPYKFIIYRSSD